MKKAKRVYSSKSEIYKCRIFDKSFKYFNMRPRFVYLFLKLRAFNGFVALEQIGSKGAHLFASFQTFNLPRAPSTPK